MKARGTVVNVAIWEKEVPFQLNTLVFREAQYKAAFGYRRKDFQAVIENLADGGCNRHKGFLLPRKSIEVF